MARTQTKVVGTIIKCSKCGTKYAMYEDIHRNVGRCWFCGQMNTTKYKINTFLYPPRIPIKPYSKLHLDHSWLMRQELRRVRMEEQEWKEVARQIGSEPYSHDDHDSDYAKEYWFKFGCHMNKILNYSKGE